MLDHVSIQVRDLTASAAFYDAVLAPLGHARGPQCRGHWQNAGSLVQCSVRRAAASDAVGAIHVACFATERSQVIAFRDAAARVGGEVLHEPRVFDDHHPNYFAAFVRDPDGNNVEAVCHTAV